MNAMTKMIFHFPKGRDEFGDCAAVSWCGVRLYDPDTGKWTGTHYRTGGLFKARRNDCPDCRAALVKRMGHLHERPVA